MERGIVGSLESQQRELERLNLVSQPFTTLKLFLLAMVDYLRSAVVYLLSRGGWVLLSSTIAAIASFVLVSFDGSHEKHLEELFKYLRFVMWWIALGVASSIGLGSGLHTFVLYLGPHIAFFTIKAAQCGRVDLKTAPYDTILLKNSPSWLHKNCSDFGEPVFERGEGFHIPIRSVLPQIQLEAVLWGLGTALGELPPYFISRAGSPRGNQIYPNERQSTCNAARLTGGLLEEGEEQGAGFMAAAKRWFRAHSQHLNFFTILLLASVPNPLFDLAGIMCGQFGIPFWKFFSATVLGKAVVKTHIQTIFIISLFNNQLLDWVGNELILIPGVGPAMQNLLQKLRSYRNKYTLEPSAPKIEANKPWDLSLLYNTVVWLVLLKFFIRIVESTAQQYWKRIRDVGQQAEVDSPPRQ